MKVFLYDGSFEGLLTCIYYAFYSVTPPTAIYSKKEFDEFLLDEIVEINTEEDKYNKVRKGIINKVGSLSYKNIYLVYLSNNKDKEIIIFKYLKIAFKVGSDINNLLNLDIVKLVYDITRRVSHEAHKFTGFIRFNLVNNKFLYSSIEPDNDILELIAHHFTSRFSNEFFIIHDIIREKALIYDTCSYEIIQMDSNTYNILKDSTDEYSDLWKEYFKSTTIKERFNPKLQEKLMPKRYWKHIIETK